ncbi:LytTR family two component transcriptional regulator [Dokdonia sp. Hel_I_63]|uniref:LytR/AlgR family response regulator transcription factor n=1 Tax=unclassified Dokdonia TaxID=2615033 RepID=UPI00020A6456|nr:MULTISPECIES: LytTR family DNA-binding domain-containing protein [unclassified Dokdonia]AEE18375.1 two component transcriptional regulator, LytTR family [Dokdonia sp. 4H-3-7-5]TVZ22392.1 LytTR family two component transcriptional regulator [Dokdonia sp. Hel_I_63]
METYQAIIIDDEPMAREILENHLAKITQVNVVAVCKNATEGFSALSKHDVDLVFLDINMPEVTGLMFAKAIQGTTKIIFTTAYREYAVEGFDLQAVDYLLKPISLERLMKALQKFYKEVSPKVESTNQETFSFFRSDRKMIKVDFNNILYIESIGDYLKIHTTNDVIVTRETLLATLEKLPATLFLRTHRSYVVAISNIESFTNEHININNKAIPISRSYRDQVLSILNRIK